MKKKYKIVFSIFLILFTCCNKEPYSSPYKDAIGYVVGKEICKNDDKIDYWLIDITSTSTGFQQYGDTLTLNGIKYNNVVKTTTLSDKLKIIGQKIFLDFDISDKRVVTNNCIVSNPTIYPLKEVIIVISGEQR